jgi:hypothetical protein
MVLRRRKRVADEPSIAERVASMLGRPARDHGNGTHEYAWSYVPVPPLPRPDLIVDAGGAAVAALLRQGRAEEQRGRGRPLAMCYALGLATFARANQEPDASCPAWLLDDEQLVDPLDLLFLGACWPDVLPDPVTFGNARDAWLHALTGTRHDIEVARLIAAGVAVADETEGPIDGDVVWYGLALRAQQARIGERPLARGLLPGSALAGSRIFEPPMGARFPPVPPDADERLDRFVAYLGQPLTYDHTVHDVLRAGLALLLAGFAAGLDIEEVLLATAEPEDDEERLNIDAAADEVLGVVPAPHELLQTVPTAMIRTVLDEASALVLLPALALGARPRTPPGTAVRQAVSWACGLLPPTPLINVTDTVLVAAQTSDHTAASLLGKILTMPDVAERVRPDDHVFHGDTGIAFANLAMTDGVKRVRLSAHEIRKADPVVVQEIELQIERVEATRGRRLRPDEPIPMSLDADDTPAAVVAAILDAVGANPLTLRAVETSGMMPPLTGRFPDRGQQREWDAAVTAAAGALDVAPDEAVEIVLRDIGRMTIAILGTLIEGAREDPRAGVAAIRSLTAAGSAAPIAADRVPDDAPGDIGTHAVAGLLRHRTPWLLGDGFDDDVVNLAREYSHAWGDAALTRRVDVLCNRCAMGAPKVEWPDVAAAFCLVAAAQARR